MVSVGGLASGIDTQGILQKLLELERRPIAQLQNRVRDLQRFQAAYSGLAGLISDLRSAATGLSASSLSLPSVNNGAPEVAAVSATDKADSASHDLVVRQLASAHRIAAQGWADTGTTAVAAAAGTFTLQVGATGAQISVAVNGQTTLGDLARAINAAGGDVTASIVNDGTRANAHRLVLSSTKTGAANAIRVTSNPTSLDFSSAVIEAPAAGAGNAGTYTGTVSSSGTYTGTTSKTYLIQVLIAGQSGTATFRYSHDGGITWADNGGAGFRTGTGAQALGTEGVQVAFSNSGTLSAGDTFAIDVTHPTLAAARDAAFSLDGIDQARPDNTVSDALSGVSLDLLKADAGKTASFSVSRPDSTIVDKANALVRAYNALAEAVKKQQSFNPEERVGGLLLGDATANALMARLRKALVDPAEGVPSGPRALVDLGFKSSKNGTLSLDEEKLRAMLKSDRAAVLKVLSSTETSSSSQLTVTSRPSDLAAGTYEVSLTRAPSKAEIQASAAFDDSLAADEQLSFTYTAEAGVASPRVKSFAVNLAAGDNLTTSIDKLNSAFATQGVSLRAYSSGGVLALEALDYGSQTEFSVVSDVAAGSGSTRLGTTTASDRGEDIQGTIGRQAAVGAGATLSGSVGSTLAGFALRYTGQSTGFVGTVDVTIGAGSRFEGLVAELNSGEGSLLGARDKGLQKQIDAINKSIVQKEDQAGRVEARLKAQFVAMETALGAIKAQGDFLTNQLARLG